MREEWFERLRKRRKKSMAGGEQKKVKDLIKVVSRYWMGAENRCESQVCRKAVVLRKRRRNGRS